VMMNSSFAMTVLMNNVTTVIVKMNVHVISTLNSS
jgi:hypothetical protein